MTNRTRTRTHDTQRAGTVENLSYNSIRAAEREMLNEENLAALRGGQLVCIICHHNKVKELKQRLSTINASVQAGSGSPLPPV